MKTSELCLKLKLLLINLLSIWSVLNYHIKRWLLTEKKSVVLTRIIIFRGGKNTPRPSSLLEMNPHSCTSKLAS